jgi:hypothetical protein
MSERDGVAGCVALTTGDFDTKHSPCTKTKNGVYDQITAVRHVDAAQDHLIRMKFAPYSRYNAADERAEQSVDRCASA